MKQEKQKLKLYVWTKFSPDYYSGLAFAIAKDENEARRLVVEQYGFEPSNWGPLKICSLNKRFARCVVGGS